MGFGQISNIKKGTFASGEQLDLTIKGQVFALFVNAEFSIEFLAKN